MAHQIPKVEPERVAAGDTWAWSKSLGDYPAGTWTLTYYFVGEAGAFSIIASADGLAHAVSVAKATTAAYTPGDYRGEGFVDDGTSRYLAWSGNLTVAPDQATQQAGFDTRGQAQRTLDAINAVIERRASRDQASLSVEGRSLSRAPLEDLLRLRNDYEWKVKNEKRADRIAQGLNGGGGVQVRF